MRYQELHIDSSLDAQSGTDINKPSYDLPAPWYLEKFALKSATVPLTISTIPSDVKISVIVFLGDTGLFYSSGLKTLNKGIVDTTGFLEWMEETTSFIGVVPAINTALGAAANLVLEPIPNDYGTTGLGYRFNLQMGSATADPTDYIIISFDSSATNPSSYQLQKMLGLNPGQDSFQFTRGDDVSWYANVFPAMRLSQPLFLLLRSNSLGHGSHYLLNAQGGKYFQSRELNASMSNVIAKVPISSQGAVGQYIFYYNDFNGSYENAFTFNGKEVNTLDFYWTYPHSNVPVDFNGFPFTLTLSYWTCSPQE